MTRWIMAMTILLTMPLYAQSGFVVGFNNTSIEKDRIDVYWNNLYRSLEVKAEGAIQLSDDDRDIVGIERGAYLVISERTLFKVRELRVNAGIDGAPVKVFTIGNHTAPFDDYAKNWLADILPDVVRYTGLGATYRIQSIVNQGGIEAAIREISYVETNGAKVVYYSLLLDRPEMTSDLLQKVVRKLGEEISSSTRLKEVLASTAKKFPEDSILTVALLRAASEISSSSNHKEALIEIARQRKLTAGAAVAMAESIEDISSSSGQADALEVLAELSPASDDAFKAYLKAVKDISSSSAQQNALMALLKRTDLSGPTYIGLFKTVEYISSSSAQGDVLVKAAAKCPSDEVVLEAYLQAVVSISSSSAQGHALMAMLEKPGLSKTILTRTMDVAKSEVSSRSVEEQIKDRVYELMTKN